MIRIRHIDHVVIRTRDREALTRFYCDVLGCVVERCAGPADALAQLRAGASLIDIVAVDHEPGRVPAGDGRNMDHFCVRLETFDEQAIRAHLARHGVAAGAVETRYGAEGNGPSMYVQDPDGNTVELKGPPHRPAPGLL